MFTSKKLKKKIKPKTRLLKKIYIYQLITFLIELLLVNFAGQITHKVVSMFMLRSSFQPLRFVFNVLDISTAQN